LTSSVDQENRGREEIRKDGRKEGRKGEIIEYKNK
jgi:hypothetical protein